jgi:hypothetical protein
MYYIPHVPGKAGACLDRDSASSETIRVRQNRPITLNWLFEEQTIVRGMVWGSGMNWSLNQRSDSPDVSSQSEIALYEVIRDDRFVTQKTRFFQCTVRYEIAIRYAIAIPPKKADTAKNSIITQDRNGRRLTTKQKPHLISNKQPIAIQIP